jgi:hypothetical protein
MFVRTLSLSCFGRHNAEIKVQEDFMDLGGALDKLDVYVAHCDAVVHLAGDMTGVDPGDGERRALFAKISDLGNKMPPLGEALKNGVALSCVAHALSRQALAHRESCKHRRAWAELRAHRPRAARRPRMI